MKYKIKIDRATAEHTRAVISHALQFNRPGDLYTASAHEHLLPFADMLERKFWGGSSIAIGKAKPKIVHATATLTLFLGEAAIYCAQRHVMEPSCAVVNQYVLQPILKQVNA